jgi:uncharacterized protein YcfJ
MNKLTVSIIALMSMASTAYATERVMAEVEDIYITVNTSQPYNDTVCENVRVPIYSTVTTNNNNAAGGALLGMIIGGLAGDAISDGNGTATAGGALIGGMVGADRGSRPVTRQEITGYRNERQCSDVVRYRNVSRREYSHSILYFTVGGTEYTTNFTRTEMH